MDNTRKCALVIGGKVCVAWKRKILHDVIGGHQEYIHEKIDLWRIEFCSWLRPRPVSRLRRDYKATTLGKIRCIYAVLANKIIRCIHLCCCVFMSRFGRDLNPVRDG